MSEYSDKIQDLMDEVYDKWRKSDNKSKWEVLEGFSDAHKIAVTFGNFNYQVENGGIEQWIYNGYFHDDSEKFIEYLETGAEIDSRCRNILDRIYQLDQYAQETGSDRDGYFHDPDDGDGESSFIGDIINCSQFDTWYYENCGGDDWWELVCGIIDKTEVQLGIAAENHLSGTDALSHYTVEYNDWNSDFSTLIKRSISVLAADAEDAIQNAKEQAQQDSRDFKATKVNTVMGKDISAAQPEAVTPDNSANTVSAHHLQVYIENVHDDRIGGFTIPLPATQGELQPFLDGAEISGWQDMKIDEISSDIDWLGYKLHGIVSENMTPDTLNELNYLAAKIEDFGETERDIFSAVIESGKHGGSLADIINLTFDENLGRFDLQPAFSEEQYGDFLLDTQKDETSEIFSRFEASEHPDEKAFAAYILRLEANIKPEDFGRGAVKEEDGVFTETGYLTGGGELLELYRGPEDIPVELFVYGEYPAELRMLSRFITPDADKSELTYLADKISGMDGEQRRIFDAVTETGWYCGSVAEIINVTDNLDCFTLIPAFNEAEYGEYRLMRDWEDSQEAIARLEKSEDPADRALLTCATRLHQWADEETYGYHSMKSSDGMFTEHGFIMAEEIPKEIYRGIHDLPAGYRDTPADRASGDKSSVMAQIAEAREARRREPDHRDAPSSVKKKTEPEL